MGILSTCPLISATNIFRCFFGASDLTNGISLNSSISLSSIVQDEFSKSFAGKLSLHVDYLPTDNCSKNVSMQFASKIGGHLREIKSTLPFIGGEKKFLRRRGGIIVLSLSIPFNSTHVDKTEIIEMPRIMWPDWMDTKRLFILNLANLELGFITSGKGGAQLGDSSFKRFEYFGIIQAYILGIFKRKIDRFLESWKNESVFVMDWLWFIKYLSSI